MIFATTKKNIGCRYLINDNLDDGFFINYYFKIKLSSEEQSVDINLKNYDK